MKVNVIRTRKDFPIKEGDVLRVREFDGSLSVIRVGSLFLTDGHVEAFAFTRNHRARRVVRGLKMR